MAVTSTGRACNERVICLRIFADANGETHLKDIDIALQPKKLFKDTPPLGLTENLPASWYNICYVPKGTGETDLSSDLKNGAGLFSMSSRVIVPGAATVILF